MYEAVPTRFRWGILVLNTVTWWVWYASGIYSLSTFVTLWAEQYGLSFSLLGFVMGLVALCNLLLSTPVGLLTDKLGTKVMIPLLIFGNGLSICLRAWAIPHHPTLFLILFTIMQGVCYTMAFESLSKLAIEWWPRRQLGRVMQLYVSTGTALGSLYPTMMLYLMPILNNDWQLVSYLIFGLPSFIIAFVMLLVLRGRKPQYRQIPTEESGTGAVKDMEAATETTSMRETLATVVRNRNIWVCLIIEILFSMSLWSLLIWQWPMFSLTYGPQIARTILMASLFLGIGAKFLQGVLMDSKGRKIAMYASAVFCTISIWGVFQCWINAWPYVLAIILALIYLHPPTARVVPESVHPTMAATADSLRANVNQISRYIASWAMGYLYDIGALHVGQYVCVACCIVGTLFMPFVKETLPLKRKK